MTLKCRKLAKAAGLLLFVVISLILVKFVEGNDENMLSQKPADGRKVIDSNIWEKNAAANITRFVNESVLEPDGTISGWIGYAYFGSGGFSKFNGYWVVPTAPQTQTTQVIYLFPGLDWHYGPYGSIIQPVLLWGNNGFYGGNYWSLSSWWWIGDLTTSPPTTKDYDFSPVISGHAAPPNINYEIKTGDLIYGSMNYDSSAPDPKQHFWTITATVADKQTTLTHYISKEYGYTNQEQKYTRAIVVLEVARVGDATQLPGGTNFYGLLLKDLSGSVVTPEWSTYVDPTAQGWGLSVLTSTTSVRIGVGGVGGVGVPVDKFALLAPYVGLASTILVATAVTAIYVKRVKRREEKQ